MQTFFFPDILNAIPTTGELEKLASVGEDYNGNLSIAENGKFLSLLEKTTSSLRERYLPAIGVLNPLDLDLPSTHFRSLTTPQNPDAEIDQKLKTHQEKKKQQMKEIKMLVIS